MDKLPVDKSPEAFRTISEVAEALDTPAHVLRFWESRFPQIRPVKRAGGRRYYRPADVALLTSIRHLLHVQGLTIRGVQKILREQGVRHVAGLTGDNDGVFVDDLMEGAAAEDAAEAMAQVPDDAPDPVETATILPLKRPVAAEVPEVPEPPQAVPPDTIAEAPHVWVEAEPELALAMPLPVQTDADPVDAAVPDPVDAAVPDPALSTRLRALPRPVSPAAMVQMTELHSRLGLLHAQMAEAIRLRR